MKADLILSKVLKESLDFDDFYPLYYIVLIIVLRILKVKG